MPLFSAGQVKIESGSAGTMVPVKRVTNVNVGYNIPRANVNVMNRGKPLAQRPVINYTPVEVSLEFYKSNNDFEQSIGLVNNNNIIKNITETRNGYGGSGVRNIEIYYAPTSSQNYNGLLSIRSGVLTSYALQGSVGEPVKGSASFQCFDLSGSSNFSSRDSSDYDAALVKPENVVLRHIEFTGVGLTGVTVQSFSFSLGLSRTQVFQLGQKFPIERPLTDVNASLQVQGFFEGINDSIQSLSYFDCGSPMSGNVQISLYQSCQGSQYQSALGITRPYFDSFSIQGQAGGFSTFSLNMSMPIGPNPNEVGLLDGSIVTLVNA